MENEPLSHVDDDLFEILYAEIKNQLTREKQPVEQPFMVVLGGQPGAGKGNVYKKYASEITDNFVAVNCDDFRQYHPNFKALFQKYGDDDSDYTQDFVNKINIRLVDELSKSGYNMIMESTLRSPYVALAVNDQLRPLGYKVELCVVGTNRDVSLQGTISRKAEMIVKGEQPRGVTPSYHESVCDSIVESLSKVYSSNAMDDIFIYTREGTCLYDSEQTPELDPSPILEARINLPEKEAKVKIDAYVSDYKKSISTSSEQAPVQFRYKEISMQEFVACHAELKQLCSCKKSEDGIIMKYDAGNEQKINNILSNVSVKNMKK